MLMLQSVREATCPLMRINIHAFHLIHQELSLLVLHTRGFFYSHHLRATQLCVLKSVACHTLFSFLSPPAPPYLHHGDP